MAQKRKLLEKRNQKTADIFRRSATNIRKEIFGEMEDFMMTLNQDTIKFCLEFIDKDAFFNPTKGEKEEDTKVGIGLKDGGLTPSLS